MKSASRKVTSRWPGTNVLRLITPYFDQTIRGNAGFVSPHLTLFVLEASATTDSAVKHAVGILWAV